jgi:hypothetical protein
MQILAARVMIGSTGLPAIDELAHISDEKD